MVLWRIFIRLSREFYNHTLSLQKLIKLHRTNLFASKQAPKQVTAATLNLETTVTLLSSLVVWFLASLSEKVWCSSGFSDFRRSLMTSGGTGSCNDLQIYGKR